MKKYTYLFLAFIVFIGIITRFYGLNWDQGYHLHPDERAIVLFTIKLHFPTSINEFFSPQSTWNPHFFAYGSFPLYLLYGVASLLSYSIPQAGSYDMINLIGRGISSLADIFIILTIFLVGKKVFSSTVGLYAAVFYVLSTFAMQAAHFYAVDTLLTLCILLALFSLIRFQQTHSYKRLISFSIFFALALATKVSSILLIFPFVLTLFYYSLNKYQQSEQTKQKKLFVSCLSFIKLFSISSVLTFVIFAVCEPYALISFSEFWQQTQAQSAMTKSAFTFPYTLQYVGIIPYLYEIKNIFFWGQGPILAIICFIGIVFTSTMVYSHPEKKKLSILLLFFWTYFAVVGSFAVGFMRYMLPLYPILCLCGAFFFVHFSNKLHSISRRIVTISVFCLIAILPVSFLSIYTQPNTRVEATNWILSNIPHGKTLAGEHWDDQLPLKNAYLYPAMTLPLYDPDTPLKWSGIDSSLQQSDYLIIASNRLYTPLQKLTNCKELVPHPCYIQTARYYEELFAEKKGFKKIKEFSNYPKIPILNIPLIDDSADESFSVYDHPKIMIYKKI